MNAATKSFVQGMLAAFLFAGASALRAAAQARDTIARPPSTGGGATNAGRLITAAGPGWVVEPQAITTTTLYYFPGGETESKQSLFFGGRPTGTVVHAKLFAPRGRTLQSIQAVRVLKATDDLGREIVSAKPVTEIAEVPYSRGAQEGNSAPIQLQLPLPLPDAQSIDALSGEAIVMTSGQWREMLFPNINPGFTNEVDLTNVMAGARLLLSSFSLTNGQFRFQAQLTGPPAIRQIELQLQFAGGQRGNAFIHEINFAGRADGATRLIQVQGYENNVQEGVASRSLLVRFPLDPRCERVRFVLNGLDLF